MLGVLGSCPVQWEVTAGLARASVYPTLQCSAVTLSCLIQHPVLLRVRDLKFPMDFLRHLLGLRVYLEKDTVRTI